MSATWQQVKDSVKLTYKELMGGVISDETAFFDKLFGALGADYSSVTVNSVTWNNLRSSNSPKPNEIEFKNRLHGKISPLD